MTPSSGRSASVLPPILPKFWSLSFKPIQRKYHRVDLGLAIAVEASPYPAIGLLSYMNDQNC